MIIIVTIIINVFSFTQEKELSLEEFLQKIKKKDFRDRERLQKERNTVKIPGKEEDEYY